MFQRVTGLRKKAFTGICEKTFPGREGIFFTNDQNRGGT
jgi:hypothetical protein